MHTSVSTIVPDGTVRASMIMQERSRQFSADGYDRILSTSNPSGIVAAHSGKLRSVALTWFRFGFRPVAPGAGCGCQSVNTRFACRKSIDDGITAPKRLLGQVLPCNCPGFSQEADVIIIEAGLQGRNYWRDV
jgi:hypothetical protein